MPRGRQLRPMARSTRTARRRAHAEWRERARRRNAFIKKRLQAVKQSKWCFIHGIGHVWNDRRHQVVLVRCVRVYNSWWSVRGGRVQRLRGQPYPSEKAARRAALKHARDHVRWVALSRLRLNREEKQAHRDIARFATAALAMVRVGRTESCMHAYPLDTQQVHR